MDKSQYLSVFHGLFELCDKYKVDSLSKKMLLGHALGNDVTDLKYGHRTIEELRAEINKICCRKTCLL